ncbi:ROK family protein [Aeromicrobium sp.]|uniref:ROK family protein n=1 Tax=Aeromicrobium sp. TaxID=1871063 RepID=UPI003C4533E3
MSVVASEDLRRQNTALVLRALRRHGPTTRTELARLTGLAKATVGTIVASLEESAHVAEGDLAQGSRGRPGRPVALSGHRMVGLGLEVNVDYVAAVALDLGGRSHLLETRVVDDADPFDVLVGLASSASAQLQADGLEIVGTTVAIPGLVDRAEGMVALAPNLGWTSRPLAHEVSDALGRAVAVENDANCAALAEATRGVAVGARLSVYLTGTVGIGAGIVEDGTIVRGTSGFAGEVGHTPIGDPDAECGCGRHGCWEASVGMRAMLAAVGMEEVGTPIETAELVAQRATENAGVRDGLAGVGAILGRGIATVTNILNPDTLVLGGYFVPLAPALMPAVRRAIDELVPARAFHDVDVRLSTLGLRAAATGAAEEALSPMFDGAAFAGAPDA